MYRSNSTSNHNSAYMHPYPNGAPSYNTSHQQAAYVNGSAQHATSAAYPAPHFASMQHSQMPQKQQPSQAVYYGYGDSIQSQQTAKRLQLSGQTAPPGGSIVSGLLSNSGMAPAASGSSFSGATDPLNALQNLAARQGASGVSTGLTQTAPARAPAYQMIPPGQQQANHMFLSQNAPPMSMPSMTRTANIGYEHARVSQPQENFQRISLPASATSRPILPAAQPATRRPPSSSPALAAFLQDEEAALEKLRQLAVRYMDTLRNYLTVFPEARHRFSSVYTLLSKPTAETARSLNVSLTPEWLHGVETTLRNQITLRPSSPPAPPSPPKTDDVKGPYVVGNDLFFLLHSLSGDAEGRRKLQQARLAIHNSLQLDGVVGFPSHVSHARRGADLPPCAAADDILSDDDLPDEDEEERVDTELQPQIPLHPQDEAPKKEEEEDDEEETATPKTSFCVKEMAERLSTEVWCEIRALPAPFRVRMNGQPPEMERMETEDTCLDVGEWNSSVHLVVEYEEERLPCPLPGLCVRLPADYPEFRHLTWLVERSAYGLPEKDKEEVEVTDEGEEDTTAFKRLVGSIFEERSAKVRRTYAEELSLYRVLVTWHNAIMDAFSKYSGLEDLRKNPFF